MGRDRKRSSASASSSQSTAKRSRHSTPEESMAIVPYNPNNEDDRAVRFVVDNTYKSIPSHKAKLDRSGKYLKTHEYTLYVDIVTGDPDLIERVLFDMGSTFSPSTYISSCPVQVTQPNGSPAWRFSTTHQVYGSTKAEISIRGAGGSKMVVAHKIRLADGGPKKRTIYTFREARGRQPLRMVKIEDNQRFGIELELSSPPGIDTEMIADMMPRNAGNVIVGGARHASHTEGWKIVSDGSIVCNRNMPDCHKFEVVSRILAGGDGLGQIAAVTKALGKASIQVNKSMGFHVHVDVKGYSIEQLIKICQNFIKYEDVMDSFMPPSRRNGSPQCDRYFKSNRSSVFGDTNKQRHVRLANCCNVETLAEQMNEDGRYYKLNLQNLVTKRQPTIEFRQHSATLDYEKISAWVRFCTTFVQTSARLKAPAPFKEDRNLKFQFDALFQYVIKDRALRDYYRKRQLDVDDHCCTGCSDGGTCAAGVNGFSSLAHMK